MLSLELSSKDSGNDETPTPTRLIRNCEEVGLFQDLQNVNPFDEVFKKAVENPSSVTLQVPVSSSDDTLHTPQIYPNLDSTTDVFPLNNTITNVDRDIDDSENALVIVLDSEKEDDKSLKENKIKNVKDKVKAALLHKSKTTISPVPIDKLVEPYRPLQNEITEQVVLRREANKAAQTRCRIRKKREYDNMKQELKKLRSENKQLLQMNKELHQTIECLKLQIKDRSTSDSILGTSTFNTTREFKNTARVDHLSWDKTKNIQSSTTISSHNLIASVNNLHTLPIGSTPNSNMIIIVNGVNQTQDIITPSESRFSSVKNDIKNYYKKIVPK